MTDLACPSCSIGAHPVSAPAVCGREKAFYKFTLRDEMVLWVNSWSTTFTAASSMALQMAPRESRWADVTGCWQRGVGCSQTVWIMRGFILQGCDRAGGSSPASRCHVKQRTVHAEARFRSRTSSSERMWTERIKSVYSCLFMRVCLKPRSATRGMHPPSPPLKALRDAQQEGSVYTSCFLPVSSRLPDQ